MRIKGIKIVTVRKENGRSYRYYYHRATNKRIEAGYGTAAFAAEVAALDAKIKDQAPRDGTLKALICAYRASSTFANLAPRTRSDYDKVFDYLAPIGDMPLVELDTPFVCNLQEVAFKKRKRRFANYVVQVIGLLCEWGKPRGLIENNPATRMKGIRRPKGMRRANRPWRDEEREAVLQEAPVHLQVMIALAMFAGLREGDACALPKTGYDGKLIETVASKNGEPLWLPVHFRLRQILETGALARKNALHSRAQRRKVIPIDPPTLAVTSRGTTWTESGFRASFFALVRRLEKAGKVRPGLTFHGLRHTLGKLVMEAGGTKEDVAMILGDRSIAMGELYSRDHEKKGRVGATVHKLEQTEREKMENRADDFGKPDAGAQASKK